MANSATTTPDLAAELTKVYGRFMTRADAARELAFSVRTINRMINDGELHAYQVGSRRSLRLRTADVAALVSRVA
jgi:excisionase family DNA binding protein